MDNWTNTDDLVLTVFYQGLYNSQIQLAKYTGSDGFIATTGEHIFTKDSNGCNLIKNPWIGSELSEIELSTKNSSFLNPGKLVSVYISKNFNKRYIISSCPDQKCTHPQVSDQLTPNLTLNSHNIRFLQINFGQEVDIYECINKIQTAAVKTSQLILFGASKGAATIYNTVAYLNLIHSNLLNSVKLIILDGPYDDVSRLFSSKLQEIAVTNLSLYKSDGISPEKSTKYFPANIPVIFVTTEIDQKVPAEETIKLAKRLAEQKQNQIYLLIVNNSTHSNCTMEDDIDKYRYSVLVHSVYKKFNLPYIPKYADSTDSEKIMKECILYRQD